MRTETRVVDDRVGYALLIVRVALGIVWFMHGIQKLQGGGIAGTAGFFGSLGIPAPDLFAVVVIALETLGGLAIILGLLTRPIAVLFIIEMLVAMFTVHLPNGYYVGDGGYELVLLLAMGALALVVGGPGALALDDALGLERRFSGAGAR